MKNKTLFASILFIFLMASYGSVFLAADFEGQEKKETELTPKYKNFLALLQRIMNSEEEREAFFKLKSDRERDIFIESWWKQRGVGQRGVRTNIRMLRLARMVQALDLTGDQVAVIMPATNKNEKKKQELHRDLQLQMRNLRILLRRDDPNEQTLSDLLSHIKTLKESLQDKEVEFEKFLADHLSLNQQAKYIIFSQDFYRGLQEQLDNARRTQQRLQLQRRKKR